LSVDTPVGAFLSILLPDGIYFDESKDFLCAGTMNFASPMQCDKKNSENIELVLILEDRSLDLIKNGTILEF